MFGSRSGSRSGAASRSAAGTPDFTARCRSYDSSAMISATRRASTGSLEYVLERMRAEQPPGGVARAQQPRRLIARELREVWDRHAGLVTLGSKSHACAPVPSVAIASSASSCAALGRVVR